MRVDEGSLSKPERCTGDVVSSTTPPSYFSFLQKACFLVCIIEEKSLTGDSRELRKSFFRFGN